MGPTSPEFHQIFDALRQRVSGAVETLRAGGMLLIGDDGIRENEVDLVFHGATATAAQVNFAISHARGLLCVSVGHGEAERLGFATAPRFPGHISHTGFTLSVDARRGISSGISASDRATTMRAMAYADAVPGDFISPGHVFPVSAVKGGLVARSGHTEAVADLCRLGGLRPVAAMCEVLNHQGEALRPQDLLLGLNSKNKGSQPLASAAGVAGGVDSPVQLTDLPYLSTIDLLWYTVFCEHLHQSYIYADFSMNKNAFLDYFIPWNYSAPDQTSPVPPSVSPASADSAWLLDRSGPEAALTWDAALLGAPVGLVPQRIRIEIYDGFVKRHNNVSPVDAQVTLVIMGFGDVAHRPFGGLSDFCDLSQKEGLSRTQGGVKRCVTLLRSLQFLYAKSAFKEDFYEFLKGVSFFSDDDAALLLSSQKRG